MKKITRKNLEQFLSQHATDQVVLDIGGGHVAGNHSYTRYFPNRHTVDIDPNRQPDTVGDVHSLPFADDSHEVILCTEVLEHLHSPHVAVSELHRVLKPGGKLILTTRFMYPLHDTPHDYFRFTKYGLKFLFTGWGNVTITEEVQSFSTIGVLLQRIGFQMDLRGGKFTKAVIYTLAYLFNRMNWLIKNEYGSIKKDNKEKGIFSSGYHLYAEKL